MRLNFFPSSGHILPSAFFFDQFITQFISSSEAILAQVLHMWRLVNPREVGAWVLFLCHLGRGVFQKRQLLGFR